MTMQKLITKHCLVDAKNLPASRLEHLPQDIMGVILAFIANKKNNIEQQAIKQYLYKLRKMYTIFLSLSGEQSNNTEQMIAQALLLNEAALTKIDSKLEQLVVAEQLDQLLIADKQLSGFFDKQQINCEEVMDIIIHQPKYLFALPESLLLMADINNWLLTSLHWAWYTRLTVTLIFLPVVVLAYNLLSAVSFIMLPLTVLAIFVGSHFFFLNKFALHDYGYVQESYMDITSICQGIVWGTAATLLALSLSLVVTPLLSLLLIISPLITANLAILVCAGMIITSPDKIPEFFQWIQTKYLDNSNISTLSMKMVSFLTKHSFNSQLNMIQSKLYIKLILLHKKTLAKKTDQNLAKVELIKQTIEIVCNALRNVEQLKLKGQLVSEHDYDTVINIINVEKDSIIDDDTAANIDSCVVASCGLLSELIDQLEQQKSKKFSNNSRKSVDNKSFMSNSVSLIGQSVKRNGATLIRLATGLELAQYKRNMQIKLIAVDRQRGSRYRHG